MEEPEGTLSPEREGADNQTGGDPITGVTCEVQPTGDCGSAEVMLVGGANPCAWEFPSPMDEQSLCGATITLWNQVEGGARNLLVRVVANAAECTDDVSWHFEDADERSRALLCPLACANAMGIAADRGSFTPGCSP